MKKVKTFLSCAVSKIKKKFFKYDNNDIDHACEKFKEMSAEATSIEELKLTKEYALKYNTTTRWQTL